jgi:uroporphyrinogen-III synthase
MLLAWLLADAPGSTSHAVNTSPNAVSGWQSKITPQASGRIYVSMSPSTASTPRDPGRSA